MSKFLRDVILFLVVLFLIDRGVFYILQNQRPIDYKYFLENKQSFFQKKENIDLLIIGDSHIADAIDPRILKKENNLNTFNLAIYHASPFETYYTTLKALDHLEQAPKIILIGTNPIMFNRPIGKGKYTSLITNDFLLSTQMSLDANEGINADLFFKSIEEKHLIKPLVKKYLGKKYHPTREVTTTNNGFLEFKNQKPNQTWSNFKTDPNHPSTINPKQIEYFEKTIKILLEKKIKVIFVNPPIWSEKLKFLSESSGFDSFKNVLHDISLKNNIPIYNADDSILQDELVKNDFLDPEHLNHYGAVKFTHHLSSFLKQNQTKN